MSTEGYNGYTNYETWNVSLWLDNDQGTYEDVREQVAQMQADDDESVSAYRVGAWLREYVEELAENTCPGVIEGASFVADMFQAALSEVNWYEIASNLIEELAEA